MTEQTITTLIITLPAILIAITGLIVAVKSKSESKAATAKADNAEVKAIAAGNVASEAHFLARKQ